jgi:hypothetical protein
LSKHNHPADKRCRSNNSWYYLYYFYYDYNNYNNYSHYNVYLLEGAHFDVNTDGVVSVQKEINDIGIIVTVFAVMI